MAAEWFSTDFISGLATAGVPFTAWWYRIRTNREHRADKIYDKVMARMGEELDKLRAEVAMCKQRDARVLTIETCFRLIVPVIVELDPKNAVLVHITSLLKSLPVPETGDEWEELLARVERALDGGIDAAKA